MNFAGFTPAFQGASSTEGTLRTLHDQANQQQARSILTKIFQQYSQPGQGGLPQSTPPILPAMTPQPGGVSPAGGGMAPPGGAPGGVGPVQPQGAAPSLAPIPGLANGTFPEPSSSNMGGGIDLQRLVQAINAQNASPGAQGYALQDSMKLLQPSAALDTRARIADMNNTTRRDIAADNIAARERIAEANRVIRTGASAKLKDDAIFRALEARVKAAQSANAAAGTDDTYAALTKASDELLDYARAKGATPETNKTAPDKATPQAQPETASPAAEAIQIQPGEPTAQDASGNTLVVRNGAWVKAQPQGK